MGMFCSALCLCTYIMCIYIFCWGLLCIPALVFFSVQRNPLVACGISPFSPIHSFFAFESRNVSCTNWIHSRYTKLGQAQRKENVWLWSIKKTPLTNMRYTTHHIMGRRKPTYTRMNVETDGPDYPTESLSNTYNINILYVFYTLFRCIWDLLANISFSFLK